MSGHKKHYFKVYILLLVLFAISVTGPEVAEWLHLEGGIRLALVLSTAFGIALVKAYYVCVHFMHLKGEKIYAPYILMTCIAVVVIFFFGTATDSMKAEGHNWHKTYVEPAILDNPGHGDAHDDHGAADAAHDDHGTADSHEGNDHH